MAVIAISAGCGEHEAVKDFNALADKACACEDMACIQGVAADMKALQEKHKDAKGTQATIDKIKAAGEKANRDRSQQNGATECFRRGFGDDRGVLQLIFNHDQHFHRRRWA